MHKCIPYANNNIFMMIRNWVLTGMGGTDKSVPYAHVGTYPIQRTRQIPSCPFAEQGRFAH